MMGLGPMGSGAGGANSSSSTSNLSALAPPFTVDRLNPKPNSNPLVNYSDSPYAVEPFSHAWQYARPSAPRPELVIDSTGITSVPLSDDYRFSASASISPSSTHWSVLSPVTKPSVSAFAYGGEVKPYYSPYVPPLVGDDSLFVEDGGPRYNVVPTSGLSVTSQIDYTQSLFDLEYGPRWVDSLGFDDGKRAKRVELDGSFLSEKANVGGSHSYKNQLNQGLCSLCKLLCCNSGGCGTENRNKSKEDSGVSYQKFNQVSDREVHTGSLGVGLMEDKSCLEQNVGFFPYDSNKTHIPASSSTYAESYPSVLSCEMYKNFSNIQNSCSPFEKCVRPVDTPFTGPASVMRSSPAVVIRPPPVTNGNLGQSIVSRKPARSDNVGGGHSVDFDHSNPSKRKDSGLKPSSEIKEDSFETNLFNFSMLGNGFISSTSVKELQNPMLSRDPFDRKIKTRFGSQLPDINVLGGFAMACDNVQVVNSTEDSSDFIDHHNPAVDSPCWKGAPSSQISPFDVEAGNSNHVKKKLDECYGFDHEEHQNLPSIVDSNRVFSEKVGEGNKNNENECARNGVVLALERTLDAICSSKEQNVLDDANGRVWISTMTSSKGVEISDDANMPRKESGLLNNLTSGFDMKVSDTKDLIGEEGAGMTLNDVSEGGAVAVHAAEKVLASPASQEDATESTIPPDPKLNVPTMIKAIHNLSELLLFHLSSDTCSLEEENTGTLKHIISNLDSCLSKKIIQATNKPEPNNPVGDTSEKLGESRDVGTISGSPRMTNEAPNSHFKLDYRHMHEEEKNYIFSGKKDEKSPNFSPLRDDLDITRDDDMAKAIKKVLEENFHLNEEMHSQALLFKSLWLEAEAKLCSISYKARFDRMKIQMEEIKLKAPKENEDIAETMSRVCISPDPITASELIPKAHECKIPKPTLGNVSISSTSGHADDIEALVMARFNILKSREDNPKPINSEEEQQPEMVDGEHAGSIMARFNILKSREENSKSICIEEEQQSKMIDGEFAGEKYLGPCIRSQSEDETLNVALKPHFLHQTDSLGEGRFGSYVDGDGYESLNEFHLSVTNDPIIHSFKNSWMINQNNSGWHDSSTSDWEHVLKDDFSWKNM
ncbi:hypothetical protein Pfo_014588 [Paulownia fortunei]|nr:hypothetical protein Pfo_014588 [Paulownia fortunei]